LIRGPETVGQLERMATEGAGKVAMPPIESGDHVVQ
jgi:hypothetical protein